MGVWFIVIGVALALSAIPVICALAGAERY